MIFNYYKLILSDKYLEHITDLRELLVLDLNVRTCVIFTVHRTRKMAYIHMNLQV